MMDMVPVWLKRITMPADTMQGHADHIKKRNEQRTDGNQDKTGMPLMFKTCQHDAQQQETHDESKRQRTGVAHKDFLSLTAVAEDIIKPERHDNTKSREGNHRIDELSFGHEDRSHHKQGNGSQSRSQSVDTIYQVKGIGDIHHHKDGSQITQPFRQGIYPHEISQTMHPQSRHGYQDTADNLSHELPFIAYAYQVIAHTHHI